MERREEIHAKNKEFRKVGEKKRGWYAKQKEFVFMLHQVPNQIAKIYRNVLAIAKKSTIKQA